jgi:hypothetical protein
MALSGQSSPFALICRNLVSRVSSALGISTDFIRPVANDDYAVTETEDLFAFLRPYAPSPIDATNGAPFADQGAGRYAVTVGRRVRIYLYTRSGEDVVGGDEIALQGIEETVSQTVETPPEMPGHFVAEELVINALQNYVPINEAGDAPLTIGPVHWISGEGGPPERKKEDSEGLIRSYLDFQVVYVLAITATEPAPASLASPVN